MERFTVLMFGPHLKATSGISNVVNNWIEAGIERQVNVYYISTLRHYVQGRYIHKIMNAMIAYIRLIIKTFGKIDIVHIHMSSNRSFYRKWFIYKWSKFRKIKTVIHLHGSEFQIFYHYANKPVKRMILEVFESADAIFVVSDRWKTFVSSICNNQNIQIIYNGANLEKYTDSSGGKDRINVTFMGRLGERKGVFDLLSAFEKIIPLVRNAHLVLGGDGEVEKARRRIEENNNQERIHVLGWVSGEKKIEVFKECDIYVLPSYNEGLPGSILEAMAVGVPIISTTVGGIPDAVQNDINGYLINPGDVEKLYRKLLVLCQDEELRKRMGKESQKIVRDKFNIRKIVHDLLEQYEMIMKQNAVKYSNKESG